MHQIAILLNKVLKFFIKLFIAGNLHFFYIFFDALLVAVSFIWNQDQILELYFCKYS